MNEFLAGPLVAPLYGLLVVSALGMALGIYRSIQQDVFDPKKLPGILDSTVLRKIVPLAVLGIAAASTAAGPAQTGLLAAYTGATLTAYAAEVTALIEKVTGAFVATTKDQDTGIVKTPAQETIGVGPVAS